jgi:hypothetical protein
MKQLKNKAKNKINRIFNADKALLLALMLFLSGASIAFASLTISGSGITGDSSFTGLTGATSTTIDVGSGNTLYLQTTNNGPINTGTGSFTASGTLNVTATTTLSSSLNLIDPSSSNYIRDLYFGRNSNGVFMSNTNDVDNNPEEYIFFYKSTTGIIDGTITYSGNDEHDFWLGLRNGDTGGSHRVLRLIHDTSSDIGALTIDSGRDLTNTSLTADGPYNIMKIVPTINMTSGNYTIRGIYYNPTLTSMVGVTHVAFQNTSGDVLLGTSSGKVGVGTTTPATSLHIASASSTVRIGTGSIAGCLELLDSSGNGVINYITASGGTLSATTTKPAICQ